jgi:hypothetical protein
LIGFPARFLAKTQQVEPQLMTSRDGLVFQRWQDPVIPMTAPKDRDTNRGNYMAWGMVQLPGNDNELSMYATEAYYGDVPGRLRRFTYRLDGFVSASASEKGGEVVTKPLQFKGEKLVVNFSTTEKGSVAVEVQDAAGRPLEGLSLKDSPPLTGDSAAQSVTWKGAQLARLAGTPVRLRFVLRNADVFSFQFR